MTLLFKLSLFLGELIFLANIYGIYSKLLMIYNLYLMGGLNYQYAELRHMMKVIKGTPLAAHAGIFLHGQAHCGRGRSGRGKAEA